MLRERRSHLAFLIVFLPLLAACGSEPEPRAYVAPPAIETAAPNDVPVSALGRGIYKVGHPYQVGGSWYYPAENTSYDETGIASWYGPNFHENYTANGEIFDQNTLSAAHRTLPMPSIVQVTNLENGRMIQVRVNDRGPFVGDRVIDLSRRASQLLGFERQGTARVRVTYLVPESLTAQSIARSNGADNGGEAPHAVPTPVVVAEALGPANGPAPATPPMPSSQYVRPSPPAASVSSHYLTPPAGAYAASPPRQTAFREPDHVLAPPHGGMPGPALPQRVTVIPVSPTHIYIQAGSFAVSQNAYRMKQRLSTLGQVSVASAAVNGLSVYRVRLGPIATVDEADRLRAAAVQAGATEAKIVVD